MFGLYDLFRLIVSALIILPITTIIRESGYYFAVTILGAKEKKLIVGSGPILFTLPTIEVRRYFFMYSWMEYEELNPSNRFWHGLIYASPIISPLVVGLLINSLLATDILESNMFWSTFLFYIFYYVFFDLIPVYLPDGQPTNGRAIFDLIWHGQRSDYMKEDYKKDKPSTKDNRDGYTEAQEDTIENRDRDQEDREDHTDPEHKKTTEKEGKGYTNTQEDTIENRDRDQEERKDHTSPGENGK
ncbi:hypothetical protein [Alkalicoccobacillus murimartini]|uniref:Uncharacterized protein n=1 Tax=Alkalicoccobacillus murimartini TaxID=171685 RepID=A0ABT9YLR3_9BACI|nr:hypothetical protein [Alkalicoccobacillus murimartini]MDQ0208802.1 hypothetical protein [Alkalicoccobacillus murimartini]